MKAILIEDDLAAIELVKYAFKTLKSSTELIFCGNSETLFQVLSSKTAQDISYILLDLNMPKANGLDILKSLSANPKWNLLPVIVLSTSADAGDIKNCYRLGANAYAVKPLLLDDFEKMIQKIDSFWGKENRIPSSI